jgi:hypothetical protein
MLSKLQSTVKLSIAAPFIAEHRMEQIQWSKKGAQRPLHSRAGSTNNQQLPSVDLAVQRRDGEL